MTIGRYNRLNLNSWRNSGLWFDLTVSLGRNCQIMIFRNCVATDSGNNLCCMLSKSH